VLEAKYPVGLVADQSGGDRGMFVPFFGRLTSTYKSIGLLAMQTGAVLVCGTARRLRPDEAPAPGALRTGFGSFGPPSMRYAIELTDVFGPEDWESQPDPLFYLTARYRLAMERMIRRAPEQYLWMHRMWRARAGHERHGKPFPPALRDKLLALPWLTAADVDAIVERSARDAAAVANGEEL
jgi:KDO2-lipid IV(A) lauroyltransferase